MSKHSKAGLERILLKAECVCEMGCETPRPRMEWITDALFSEFHLERIDLSEHTFKSHWSPCLSPECVHWLERKNNSGDQIFNDICFLTSNLLDGCFFSMPYQDWNFGHDINYISNNAIEVLKTFLGGGIDVKMTLCSAPMLSSQDSSSIPANTMGLMFKKELNHLRDFLSKPRKEGLH